MKLTGRHTVRAPRQAVYDALHDPAVLARTLPGCQQLEVTGDDTYTATVHAGIASVKGTYRGSVTLSDQVAPSSYRMRAQGAGSPGTIAADAVIRLEENGDGTVVQYEADAILGGMIGGVGQRMLVGVAQRTAGEFFSNVERELTGEPGPVRVDETVPAAPAVGRVYPGAPPAPRDRRVDLVLAALVGATLALVGVLIGRRTAR